MRRAFVLLAAGAVVAGALTGPAIAATATCAGRPATIVGTAGNDRLQMTEGDDIVAALGGADAVVEDPSSKGGDDLICGGTGDDTVHPGDGADRVYGEDGDDFLYGADGADRLDGGEGSDHLDGGAGGDVLLGRAGRRDWLLGGSGPDRVFGGAGRDTVSGDRGRDHVDGGPAYDVTLFRYRNGGEGVRLDLATGELSTVDGRETSTGIEAVIGSPYTDLILGTAGPNELDGQGGSDRLLGRGGNDKLLGHEVWGGAGHDLLIGDRALGHDGNDRFFTYVEPRVSPVIGYGGAGDDRFDVIEECAPQYGGCADVEVRLSGGPGTDLVHADIIDELIEMRGAEPYRFDLPAGTITNPIADLVISIAYFEQVLGSRGDDTLIGTGGADVLLGGDGNDTIRGWGGHDVLAGGTRAYDDGLDTMDAGTGADTCFTSSASADGQPDTIERCETQRPVPVDDPRF